MKSLATQLANLALILVLIVVLTPAVMDAVRELFVPVLIAVSLIAGLRLLWYWTTL